MSQKPVSQYRTESKIVKCPFYRYHTRRASPISLISCEGLTSSMTISLVFSDLGERKEFMHSYCNSIIGCLACPLFQMLDKQWKDEEEQ